MHLVFICARCQKSDAAAAWIERPLQALSAISAISMLTRMALCHGFALWILRFSRSFIALRLRVPVFSLRFYGFHGFLHVPLWIFMAESLSCWCLFCFLHSLLGLLPHLRIVCYRALLSPICRGCVSSTHACLFLVSAGQHRCGAQKDGCLRLRFRAGVLFINGCTQHINVLGAYPAGSSAASALGAKYGENMQHINVLTALSRWRSRQRWHQHCGMPCWFACASCRRSGFNNAVSRSDACHAAIAYML
jgi:hypothetical protein